MDNWWGRKNGVTVESSDGDAQKSGDLRKRKSAGEVLAAYIGGDIDGGGGGQVKRDATGENGERRTKIRRFCFCRPERP